MRITLGQLRRIIREEVQRESFRDPDFEGRAMSRADAKGQVDAEMDALHAEFPEDELDDCDSQMDLGGSPPEGWSPPARSPRVNTSAPSRFPMRGGR